MLHIVTAYRFGNLQGDKYHVWAGDDRAEAERRARDETTGRGDKYGCEVVQAADGGGAMRFERVAYVCSSYGEDVPCDDANFALGEAVHRAVAGGAETPLWLADWIAKIAPYRPDDINDPEPELEFYDAVYEPHGGEGDVVWIVAAHRRGRLNDRMHHVWAGRGARADAEAAARAEVARSANEYGCRVIAAVEGPTGMRFATVRYFASGPETAPFWSPYIESHRQLGQTACQAVWSGRRLDTDPENPRYAKFFDAEAPPWLAELVHRHRPG